MGGVHSLTHRALVEGVNRMDDLISRQAAIELAMQYCPDDDGTCSKADEDMRNLLDELEDLPSAQLDTYWKEQCQSYEQTINKLIESLSTQPEIIHCKECKFYTEMRQDLNTGICSLACRHLGGDGFCSEAERRRLMRYKAESEG